MQHSLGTASSGTPFAILFGSKVISMVALGSWFALVALPLFISVQLLGLIGLAGSGEVEEGSCSRACESSLGVVGGGVSGLGVRGGVSGVFSLYISPSPSGSGSRFCSSVSTGVAHSIPISFLDCCLTLPVVPLMLGCWGAFSITRAWPLCSKQWL